MKFSCGLTDAEKLKRSKQRCEAEAERLRNWHRVFAWFPVHIGEASGNKVCHWLETVERRYPCVQVFDRDDTSYQLGWLYRVEYREIAK